jgi:hypothetical protein
MIISIYREPSRRGLMRAMRERLWSFYIGRFNNRVIHLAPRSDQPYSTHLPILAALGIITQPKRVLEYGSGLISTPAFLNRAVFPKLKHLASFENSREWHERVSSCIGDDPRIELRLSDGPIKDAVMPADLSAVDLVFVDDSDELGRAQTIAAIAGFVPQGIPVVIHDLELWHIRRSAGLFDHVFRFDGFNPQTGVAWNGRWQTANVLPLANRLVRRFSLAVPCNDLERWAQVFSDASELPRVFQSSPLPAMAPWEVRKGRRRRTSPSLKES